MSWSELEKGNPSLAQFGRERFEQGVAYIGTVSKYGYPRVHPVTPIIKNGKLYVFMYPTSPKGKDIREREYYALHCQVENKDGGKGEFYVRGKGKMIQDENIWEELRPGRVAELKETYVLFELTVNFAFSMVYDGEDIIKDRWRL